MPKVKAHLFWPFFMGLPGLPWNFNLAFYTYLPTCDTRALEKKKKKDSFQSPEVEFFKKISRKTYFFYIILE